MKLKVNRRYFLKTVVTATGAAALPKNAKSQTNNEKTMKVTNFEPLTDYAITHGGIQRMHHPRLNTEVNGQTVYPLSSIWQTCDSGPFRT